MAHPHPPTLLLVLTDDADSLRVAVPLDSWLPFAQGITDDLEALEFRMQHGVANHHGMLAFCRGALPGELGN